MSYFLLRRNRHDGELDLVTRVVYDTQQEAMQALSAESSSPGFHHEDFDFCLCYLDAAIPVLIVAPQAAPAEPLVAEPTEPAEPVEPTEHLLVPVPPQPLVTPLQDAEKASAVPDTPHDEPVPYEESDAVLDEIIEQAKSEAAEPVEETSLSDALKRAANQLESEGIKAPESVVSTAESWPWESDTKTSASEEPAKASASEEPESLAEPADEKADAAYVFDPLEEPSVDSDTLLPDRTRGSVLEDLTIVAPDIPVLGGDEDQAASTPESSAPGPDAQCDDCVYVSTCPNKEGADPVTCGNFQWKAV